MRALAMLVILIPARAALADADSLVDHLGPTEIGVGEAKRAGAIGALATRLNPAGLPLSNELVFDGGFGYRPADHASLFSAAACDSTNAVPGCFYYTYVGAEPEIDGMSTRTRAHTGGITLSKALSSRFILGVGGKYFDVETDGMDAGSGVTFDVGSTVRITETANLAVVGYNLWGAESAQFPRGVAAGLLLRPTPALSASFDAVWNLDALEDASTGRYGGGLEYFLSSNNGMVGYPLRVGGLHDVGQDASHLTAGVGFASMKMGIDVAARRQVSNGDELLVIAAIRLYGPRHAPTY
jgi:hypothetical protein